ncbi:MAG: MFS transporter [Gammaproteobacteria bacterium]|jgi:MFS family permease|nr:MFS transporter [Gammaproteobacteria bacterium]MBT3724119.1 MFS transporter [Gammaproteobacteria bacterium]MBT4075948.1 MFS transporter [Gammaproteobacteria bacterium]MBT4193926.1 MFS transporter [Gammaproteobacteria bacterium]MBT4451224.1 MFS transporter [Gammaproteobacteria bacterium]
MNTSAINGNVIRLALAQALMMSVNTLLLTSSSIIGFELAENKALATLPLAIQFFATMLTSIPASLMMNRFGRRKGFIFSSIVGFAGSLLALYAITQESFAIFCLATVLFGIYTGFGNYFRFVATEVAPAGHSSTAISYVLAGGVLAAFIGPNLASYSKDIFDIAYMGSFIAVFILYSLNLLNILWIDLPKPMNRALNDYARSLREIASQPYFIVALLSAAIGFSMMSLLMTATPLSMKHENLPFSDVAFVIQWHVLGMFAPSFFTGHLINRFGVEKIIFIGGLLMLGCIGVNLTGTTLWHFWLALFLLGLGWNFMFIGGTTMLTKTYNEAEKAKTQALNDFTVFTTVAFASLGAGILQHQLGWIMVNISVIPFILICLLSIVWLKTKPKHAASV